MIQRGQIPEDPLRLRDTLQYHNLLELLMSILELIAYSRPCSPVHTLGARHSWEMHFHLEYLMHNSGHLVLLVGTTWRPFPSFINFGMRFSSPIHFDATQLIVVKYFSFQCL